MKNTWNIGLIIIGVYLSLVSCATQVAPGGGPEDKLPPRVAAVYPAPQTTNHPTELYVKLEFDEWINATIPRSAVSISPPIEKKMKFEVKNRTLELFSRAVLDENTTYTITFAGGIKDLRGNALADPFQIVFSTGAVIDSLSLRGRVLVNDTMAQRKLFPSIGLFLMGEEREQKRYLEKYRDSVTKALDSLPLLTKEPPLFITRTDSAGNFLLSGLKAGRYRVVAFLDLNGNQKIEPSLELAGVWTHDLILDSLTSDTLWVPLTSHDTSMLELVSVSQPYANVLEAEFSRPVFPDSLFYDTNNVSLIGKNGRTLHPKKIYLGATSKRPQFYFDPAPEYGVTYTFVCQYAKDSLFRMLDTARNEVDWEWVEMAADTLAPKIARTTVESKAQNAFPHDSVIIAYEKPLKDSITEKFYIAINKDTQQVEIELIDPIRYKLKNEKPWPTDSKISILMSYPDTTLAAADTNGVRDTIIEQKFSPLLQFETVAKLKLASLKGIIPGGNSEVLVRLKNIETRMPYYANCDETGNFTILDLMEGNYFIDYFIPEDGTQEVDAGSLEPFRFGKPWRAPNDTLKISGGENQLEKLLTTVPTLK